MSERSRESWPIFVLSLKMAEDRRSDIMRQFSGIKLDFSFVDAVDCRTGVPPEYESFIDRPGTIARQGYPMSDGEFGCALSHMELYKKIIEDGLPGAIILEDDAILTKSFKTFYEAGDYRGHDLIQMCYFQARIWKWRKNVSTSGIVLRYLSENPFLTAAYSISDKGAEFLLTHGMPITHRADWPCDLVRLKACVTTPPIVRHPDPTTAHSYIGERKNLRPADFDFSAGYPKGWRRLISLSAWRRFFMKKFSDQITPGY